MVLNSSAAGVGPFTYTWVDDIYHPILNDLSSPHPSVNTNKLGLYVLSLEVVDQGAGNCVRKESINLTVNGGLSVSLDNHILCQQEQVKIHRITSYNVCYTKLLRSHVKRQL